MKTKLFGRFLAIAGAIAAVSAVSVSIYLNPPSAVKAHALDRARMQSLQQIDLTIRTYYHNHQDLPKRLDLIENGNGLSAQSNWKDPVTHVFYEYEVMSRSTYLLCADFSADSGKDENLYVISFRNHHKGHDCFRQDINIE